MLALWLLLSAQTFLGTVFFHTGPVFLKEGSPKQHICFAVRSRGAFQAQRWLFPRHGFENWIQSFSFPGWLAPQPSYLLPSACLQALTFAVSYEKSHPRGSNLLHICSVEGHCPFCWVSPWSGCRSAENWRLSITVLIMSSKEFGYEPKHFSMKSILRRIPKISEDRLCLFVCLF